MGLVLVSPTEPDATPPNPPPASPRPLNFPTVAKKSNFPSGYGAFMFVKFLGFCVMGG